MARTDALLTLNQLGLGGVLPDLFDIGLELRVSSEERAQLDALGRLKALFAKFPGTSLRTAHLRHVADLGASFGTATVSPGLLSELKQLAWVHSLHWCDAQPLQRAPGKRPQTRVLRQEKTPAPIDRKKIFAIIDHGCPFAHPALCDASGDSVVQAIWDQDCAADWKTQDSHSPDGFGYGQLIESSAIKRWLNAAATSDVGVYRAAGYDRDMRARASHGSMVLGVLSQGLLLSGVHRSPFKWPVSLQEVGVVFVQLPRTVPLAPSGGVVELCMLDGLRFVLDTVPDGAMVTAILNYGSEMGPHDGTSWFERALDQLVSEASSYRGIALKLIVPSGNAYKSKRHAKLELAKMPTTVGVQSIELGWAVPKGSDVDSVMEVWSYDDLTDVSIEVVSPTQVVRKVKRGDALGIAGAGVCLQTADGPIGQTDQTVLTLRIPPTNFCEASVHTGVAGVWRIRLTWSGQKSHVLHAFTHWGGRNMGFPKRVEAPRFLAAPDLLANGVITIKGAGGLWGSGCGLKPTMVGGYKLWTKATGGLPERSDYASFGATRSGQGKPDTSFPTEEIPSAAGILSIGHQASGLLRGRGTSFATPQAARLAVDQPSVPGGADTSTPTRGFARRREHCRNRTTE